MAEDPRSRSLGRVVVGIDGSPGSLEALDWAVDEADMLGARLEVVHARLIGEQAGQFIPGAEEDERSILERAVERARTRAPALDVVGILADPPSAKVLIEQADGARLLVVGSRGYGGFKELALGSVSQQCVHHARCPVVVVRHQGAGG